MLLNVVETVRGLMLAQLPVDSKTNEIDVYKRQVMGGVSILYLVMSGFMGALTEGSPLPGSAIVLGLLVLLSLIHI